MQCLSFSHGFSGVSFDFQSDIFLKAHTSRHGMHGLMLRDHQPTNGGNIDQKIDSGICRRSAFKPRRLVHMMLQEHCALLALGHQRDS